MTFAMLAFLFVIWDNEIRMNSLVFGECMPLVDFV